jgi:hypothetical protein
MWAFCITARRRSLLQFRQTEIFGMPGLAPITLIVLIYDDFVREKVTPVRH